MNIHEMFWTSGFSNVQLKAIPHKSYLCVGFQFDGPQCHLWHGQIFKIKKKKRFIFEIVITTLGKLCKQIPVSPWDLFNLESYIRTFLDVGSRPQIIGMYSISIFIRKKEIIDFTFGVFACEWRNHSIYMCVIPIRSLFVWRNDSMFIFRFRNGIICLSDSDEIEKRDQNQTLSHTVSNAAKKGKQNVMLRFHKNVQKSLK